MSEVAKDWKSVFEVYVRNPSDALTLAQLLEQVKELIERGPKGRREAVAQLELAINALYPHTSFDKVSRKLFRQRIAGTLKFRQEERLRELGGSSKTRG